MITVQPPAPVAAPVPVAVAAPAQAPVAYYAPPAPAPAYYQQPSYAPPPVYAAPPAPAPAPAPAASPNQPINLVINQATNSGEQTQRNEQPQVRTKTVAPLEKGQCPSCRVGDLKQHYTVKGILCALLCFPLGLICCYVWRKRKCNNCAKVLG
ncbi:uncharacterized protein LOC144432109 [Styela clava]